jgi:hypothetical protein
LLFHWQLQAWCRYTGETRTIVGKNDSARERSKLKEGLMFEAAVTWILAHPLQSVGGLAGLSILIGLFFIPGLHDVTGHGHPRC